MLEQFQYEQKPDCRLIHEWKPKSSARDEFSRHWVNKRRRERIEGVVLGFG